MVSGKRNGVQVVKSDVPKNGQHATHKKDKKRHHFYSPHLPYTFHLLAHPPSHAIISMDRPDCREGTGIAKPTLLGLARLKRHRSNYPNRVHRARRQIPYPRLDDPALLSALLALFRPGRTVPRRTDPRRPEHRVRRHQSKPRRLRNIPMDPEAR